MGKLITVHENGQPIYDITIERDFNKLSSVLNNIGCSKRRICIVSDTHVAPLYIEQVKTIAGEVASEVISFVFEAGEQSKNIDTVCDLYEKLIQAHFDRKDFLIALGGGVVGDLTGFSAATYLRGICVIQIPTTLLAMVDSSIGGKTGVDCRGFKNMVGSFYQPSAVYMNFSTLSTLSDEQYYSGYGEVIKHGLIRDMGYYSYLSDNIVPCRNRDIELLEKVVFESCRIKQRVVENDPKENGERALLNFGHTLGHAIEKLMNFSMLHGDCVSVGAVAASYISMKRGYITSQEFDGIVDMFKTLELPVSLSGSGLSADEVIKVSKSDKKMNAGQIRFILLRTLGDAIITDDVSDEEMMEALGQVL